MELSMDILVKRFKDYVSFDTQSDEDNDQACPSTPGQMVLAKHIAEELKEIGLSEVELDNHGYVMATLPANGMEDAPVAVAAFPGQMVVGVGVIHLVKVHALLPAGIAVAFHGFLLAE